MKTVGPPSWLSPEAKRIYRETAVKIPGYNPGLDRTILSMYAVELATAQRLEREIADPATPDQKRAVMREILSEQRRMVFEAAGALGLTPESRLAIERAQRAGGGWPDAS